MSNPLEFTSTESAIAEVPWVIVYVVALIIFAHGWSKFEPPTTSILELRVTTAHIGVHPNSYNYVP
jgi:hypothetical protein